MTIPIKLSIQRIYGFITVILQIRILEIQTIILQNGLFPGGKGKTIFYMIRNLSEN